MAIIKVAYKPKWTDKFYFPAIVKGMFITLRHMFKKKYTIQYPEEKWIPAPGHRGAIRLNRDEQGRVKCVSCEMCSTACPAKCISMTAGVAPWDDREKYPVRFEIDMLRCILCGMCEEACPEDAIQLTEIYDFSAYTREELIWDKERLLKNYDLTADGKYFDRSKEETGF
ncbi:NADH-quinone oxidoreductase subunit I [candidate division KSB1 bacterium]|nr:NADH-quinone oxidoreductase subunit I [candidate division KSB1 bacterium]